METESFERLSEEIQMHHKWDTAVFLKALMVLELRELNRNLNNIDLSLMEIVKK